MTDEPDIDCMACIANLTVTASAPLRRGTVFDQDTGITHAACALRVQGFEYRACELHWDPIDLFWRVDNITGMRLRKI